MGALFYVRSRGAIWQGVPAPEPESANEGSFSDSHCFELLATTFVGHWKVSARPALRVIYALRASGVEWSCINDVVNPYGDSRGDKYKSTWIIDLNRNILYQLKASGSWFVSLRVARERKLTQDDFIALDERPLPTPAPKKFPSPHWEIDVGDLGRERAFLGGIMNDFAYNWRHLLRRQQSPDTFAKLALGLVWIAQSKFIVYEAMELVYDEDAKDIISGLNLPEWKVFSDAFRVGRSYILGSRWCWFIIAQDPNDAWLFLKYHHLNAVAKNGGFDKEGNIHYTIIGLQHIIVARGRSDGSVDWAKPERLLDDDQRLCSRGMDLLLWSCRDPKIFSRLNLLPVEIQDNILGHMGLSHLALAKLGCKLGLGSPLSWHMANLKLEETPKRITVKEKWSLMPISFGQWHSQVTYRKEYTPTYFSIN